VRHTAANVAIRIVQLEESTPAEFAAVDTVRCSQKRVCRLQEQ